MLSGTIFMLLFIIIGIFGGTMALVAMNLRKEKSHAPEETLKESLEKNAG